MKKLHSFHHYVDLLLSTYKLFFKAARSVAAFVVLLAPIQAIASVFAVNAGKTIIFVTHRLTAVKYADKTLFLSKGKILGFAPHQILMQNNAAYRTMYNLQKDAYR